MRASALIPAFNEAESIGSVLTGLRRACPDLGVLVVDDGSSDRTAEIASEWGAEVLRVRRGGYANALRSGYQHLQARGVHRVVQLDADGQHPPEDAPRLLEELDRANWVVGSRANTDSPAPFARRAGNAALAQVVKAVTRVSLEDVTSGFWALDRRALGFFAEEFPGDVADANIRILGIRGGLEVREVPVEMGIRVEGESMHGGVSGLTNLGRSIWAMYRESRWRA